MVGIADWLIHREMGCDWLIHREMGCDRGMRERGNWRTGNGGTGNGGRRMGEWWGEGGGMKWETGGGDGGGLPDSINHNFVVCTSTFRYSTWIVRYMTQTIGFTYFTAWFAFKIL